LSNLKEIDGLGGLVMDVYRRENNINKEIECEIWHWMEVAQDAFHFVDFYEHGYDPSGFMEIGN
jgi:hypothetical protein